MYALIHFRRRGGEPFPPPPATVKKHPVCFRLPPCSLDRPSKLFHHNHPLCSPQDKAVRKYKYHHFHGPDRSSGGGTNAVSIANIPREVTHRTAHEPIGSFPVFADLGRSLIMCSQTPAAGIAGLGPIHCRPQRVRRDPPRLFWYHRCGTTFRPLPEFSFPVFLMFRQSCLT